VARRLLHGELSHRRRDPHYEEDLAQFNREAKAVGFDLEAGYRGD
jgi:hypothetical protein